MLLLPLRRFEMSAWRERHHDLLVGIEVLELVRALGAIGSQDVCQVRRYSLRQSLNQRVFVDFGLRAQEWYAMAMMKLAKPRIPSGYLLFNRPQADIHSLTLTKPKTRIRRHCCCGDKENMEKKLIRLFGAAGRISQRRDLDWPLRS